MLSGVGPSTPMFDGGAHHIGTTWRIRPNRPRAAAMRPFCRLTSTTCFLGVSPRRAARRASGRVEGGSAARGRLDGQRLSVHVEPLLVGVSHHDDRLRRHRPDDQLREMSVTSAFRSSQLPKTPFTRYSRLLNRLYKRLNNRLHRVHRSIWRLATCGHGLHRSGR